jgi:hypothetical protein
MDRTNLESGHRLHPLGGMVEIQDVFIKLFGGRKVDVATPAIEKDMEELYAA